MDLKHLCSVVCILLLVAMGFPFLQNTDTVQAISIKGGFVQKGTVNVGDINDLAYFPNGRYVALAAKPIPEIVNLSSMKIEKTLIGQNGTIYTIAVSDKYIASGSEDGSLFLWTLDGDKFLEKSLGDRVRKVRFSPNGTQLAVVTEANRLLQVFSVPDLKKLWDYELRGVDNGVGTPSLEWNPNGSSIAVINGQPGTQILIMNTTTGLETTSIPDTESWLISSATWNSNGTDIAFFVSDTPASGIKIDIWDVVDHKRLNSLTGFSKPSRNICWLPQSEFIIGADYDHIRIWLSNFSEFQRFPLTYRDFDLVACNPNGDQFVAHSANDLYLWAWDPGSTVERPQVHIAQPDPYSKVFGDLTVSGTAWGPKAIREVHIRIDNGNWAKAIGTSSWSLAFDISYLLPGSHIITAVSYDGINFSEPDQRIFNVTKTTSDYEITVTFHRPRDGDRVYDVTRIRGGYNNPKNYSMKNIQLLIDTGSWFEITLSNMSWSYNWNSTYVANGWHILYARAFDGYKWSNIASVSVNVYNQGNVPPPIPPQYLFIDYPLDGQIVKGMIEVKGRTQFPAGTPSVSMSIQGGSWINLTGGLSWSYEFNTTQYADGPLVILVKASNGINLSQVANRTIIVNNNNSPPSQLYLFIDQPLEGQEVSNTILVKGRVAFPSGTASVSLSIQNGSWVTLSSGPDWSYQLNTSLFSNGPLRITAKASNGLGLIQTLNRTVIVNNIIINNLPPTIKITKPINGDRLKTLGAIEGTATDDIKVVAVYVKIDDSPWQLANGTDKWNFVCNTKLVPGPHVIQSRSFDGLLYSTSDTINIEIINETNKPPPKKPPFETYIENNLFLFVLLLSIIFCISLIIIYNWKSKRDNLSYSRSKVRSRRKGGKKFKR